MYCALKTNRVVHCSAIVTQPRNNIPKLCMESCEPGPPNGIFLVAWPSLQWPAEVRGDPYFHSVTFLDFFNTTELM